METHKNWIAGEWSEGSAKTSHFKAHPWSQSENIAEVFEAQPMDFVLSVPKVKDQHLKFSKWSVDQKVKLFEQIHLLLEKHQHKIAQSESLHQGLPLEMTLASVREVIKRAKELMASLQSPEGAELLARSSARGLILISPEWALQFLSLGEGLLRGLYHSNPLVLLPALDSTSSAQWWGKILEETSLPPGVVQIFQVREEQKTFFYKHPSFKSAMIFSSMEKSREVLQQLDLFQKKVALFSAPKSFIGLLPGATEVQIREATRLFLRGQGQTRWNPTRLFFLEADEKRVLEIIESEFSNSFESAVQGDLNQSLRSPFLDKQKVMGLPSLKQKVLSEEGRVLFGGKVEEKGYGIPLLSLHLPNCSELQREAHSHLVLTSVKYPHEIAKWINSLDVAERLWLFGDSEKAEKIFAQAQVGSICVNQAWDQGLGLLPGVKSSYFGEAFQNLDSSLWCYSPLSIS